MITPPKYVVDQHVIVLPPEGSPWPPFEALVVERRHVSEKGWWYRVVDNPRGSTLGWIAEDNVQTPAPAG